MRNRLLLVKRLKAFGGMLLELPIILGIGLFAISIIVVFVLGEAFPVYLGLWPLTDDGKFYAGYLFWAWLLPIIYLAWALLLLGFFHRQDKYRLTYTDEDGTTVSEEVVGNRTGEVILLALIGAIGYYFLHMYMAGTIIVPLMVLYVAQIIGFLQPEGVIEEQARHEVPILIRFLLILVGAVIYLGSGVP